MKWVVKERVIEVWDGEILWRTLDKVFFHRSMWKLKQSKQLEQDLFALELEAAWKYILRLLARRGYFSHEMTQKLKMRHVQPLVIQQVLEKAKHYDYLNDQRELDHAIGCGQGKGPRRLLVELKRRSGFEEGVLKSKIQKMLPADQCIEQGKALVSRRYSLPQDRNKAFGFLMRRGFELDHIQKILQD